MIAPRTAAALGAPARGLAAFGPRGLFGALAVATATGVALAWVTVANDLATRGMRINALITRRQELVMERAAARTAVGIASDPRRVAVRAAEIGLAAPEEIAIVVATIDAGVVEAARPPAEPDGDSPLALRLDSARRDEALPSWRERLMAIDGWRARPEADTP